MTNHAEYEKLFVDWPVLRPKGTLGTIHHAGVWGWASCLGVVTIDDGTALAIIRDHIREVLHGMGYAVQSQPWVAGDAKVYSAAAWPYIGPCIVRHRPTYDAAMIALARAVMEREHPEQAERVRAIVEEGK